MRPSKAAAIVNRFSRNSLSCSVALPQGFEEQVPVVIMMILIHMQQVLESQQQYDHIGVIVPRQHHRIPDGPQTADPGCTPTAVPAPLLPARIRSATSLTEGKTEQPQTRLPDHPEDHDAVPETFHRHGDIVDGDAARPPARRRPPPPATTVCSSRNLAMKLVSVILSLYSRPNNNRFFFETRLKVCVCVDRCPKYA